MATPVLPAALALQTWLAAAAARCTCAVLGHGLAAVASFARSDLRLMAVIDDLLTVIEIGEGGEVVLRRHRALATTAKSVPTKLESVGLWSQSVARHLELARILHCWLKHQTDVRHPLYG